MTRYHRLFTSFWRSPKVRRWPDHQKLLGAYLLTCPHRTSEGLFWLPHGYVAQDLGWSIERVSEGYSGLKEAGFCVYDDTTETVLLVKALKYEAPAGEKQIIGAINRLADVPPSPLFSLLRDAAERYAPDFAKALNDTFPPPPPDTLSEGYRNPSDYSSSSSSSSSSSKDQTLVEQARPIDDVVLVFQTWQASTGKSRAKLDGNRRYAIQAALDRYAVEDVLAAVQGWVNDPWAERAQQNDLVQLLWMGTRRKPQNVLEKMRDLWRDGPPATVGKQTAKAIAISQQMRAMGPPGEVMSGGLGAVERDRGRAQRELPASGD